MPRVTYADRLAALAKKPLSDYDKGFVESLSDYYNRKRSLTAGRAAAVRRLEERYSEEALAKAAANPILERLSAVAAFVPVGSWDEGFVESLTNQAKRGRDLSPRQLEVLVKIEERNNESSVQKALAWKTTYSESPELQEKAKVVAKYYSGAGYYQDLSRNILHTEGFVPSHQSFKRFVENKFAQKILSAWYDEPKYPEGTYVSLRATAPGVSRGKMKGAAIVIKTNALVPKSPAKGAKIYQVLPFGSAATIMVEERYLKSARLGGKK